MIEDLPPIPGVSPLLLTAINDRFRRVPTAPQSASPSKPTTETVVEQAGGPTVLDLTIKATSAPVRPPATAGAHLVVILRPDGSGAPATLWGPEFSAVTSDFDTTAGTVTVFQFVLSASVAKYLQVGQPTTGMTP